MKKCVVLEGLESFPTTKSAQPPVDFRHTSSPALRSSLKTQWLLRGNHSFDCWLFNLEVFGFLLEVMSANNLETR